jgi:competence protein ComEA
MFGVLALHLLDRFLQSHDSEFTPCRGPFFVQIDGDVAQPGVYAFPQAPDGEALLRRSETPFALDLPSDPFGEARFQSGTKVSMKRTGRSVSFFVEDMSAFYKLTLGLPLSLNGETTEGLAAIPGIGPRLASAIVREREKRGGFRSLKDILSVRGIGPATYRKIKPYLIL